MTSTVLLPPTSTDTLLNGAIRLRQPAPGYGYRFNADSLLLADFAGTRMPTARRVADLGAGVGTVGIAYASRSSPNYLLLIDIDLVSCELARSNLQQLPTVTSSVLHEDVAHAADWASGETFDVVLSNPPYTETGTGRQPRAESLRRARQGSLDPFIAAAKRLLSNEGSLFVCYPASSFIELVRTLGQHGLNAITAQFVHSSLDRPARLVLLQATKSPTQALVLLPGIPG